MRVEFKEAPGEPGVWELSVTGEGPGTPEKVRLRVRDVAFEVLLGREATSVQGGGTRGRYSHGYAPDDPAPGAVDDRVQSTG